VGLFAETTIVNKPLHLIPIPLDLLTGRVLDLKTRGFRLAQIGAARRGDILDLTYSFGKDLELVNLRVEVPARQARIPSISPVFWCAFVYENEIHDLFDIEVDNLAVDFQGHFYETAVRYPFGSPRAPLAPPASLPGGAVSTVTAASASTP